MDDGATTRGRRRDDEGTTARRDTDERIPNDPV
jgi:hypothetical protein